MTRDEIGLLLIFMAVLAVVVVEAYIHLTAKPCETCRNLPAYTPDESMDSTVIPVKCPQCGRWTAQSK
jgi:hypothetical protein